jgi:hypothetical protein
VLALLGANAEDALKSPHVKPAPASEIKDLDSAVNQLGFDWRWKQEYVWELQDSGFKGPAIAKEAWSDSS